MTVHSVLLTVATPGTPVQLPVADACGLQVVAWKGNAPEADGYLGLAAGMNITTGAGVIQPLVPRASWAISVAESANRIHIGEYAVDADTAGDKFLVTYWEN